MIDYANFLIEQGFVIFLFHGVIREQDHRVRNYTNKHLVLERFATILNDLCVSGSPVSMPDIVLAKNDEIALPKRAFAVTFDDGFENNYSVAAPLLHDLGIPATFYITTSFIDSNSSSWIDMIEYAVEKVDKFELKLPSLDVQGIFTQPEQKIELLDQIRLVVKNDPDIDPYEFAHDIWRQLDIETFEPDSDLDQKMNWAQIRELSQNDLFTIGGHSHTHRILAYLDRSELESEIRISLKKLREHLDEPVEHYSYPEGLAHCYSNQVINVLKRYGIVCSPTAEPGSNHIGDSLFHLKRIMVI